MKETIKAACIHCGMMHTIEMRQHEVGQILMPYEGGGDYGRCLRCGKEGLRVETIPHPVVRKPKGWAKVPSV
jgi:ribosomal protein L37E